MKAYVQVPGSTAPDDILELFDWVHSERQLAGQVNYMLRPPVGGEMGGAPGVVLVLLGSSSLVTALAGSLTSWLKARRSDVTLRVTTEHGSVTVGVTNAAEGQILPLLQRVIDDQRS
jgi:Effector Associated Constant Component 1